MASFAMRTIHSDLVSYDLTEFFDVRRVLAYPFRNLEVQRYVQRYEGSIGVSSSVIGWISITQPLQPRARWGVGGGAKKRVMRCCVLCGCGCLRTYM